MPSLLIRVTLAYDDLPAAGGLLDRGAAALRNDLDLFLIAPDGSVFRPRVLDPDNPTAAAATDVDHLNPLEVVDVQNPAGGEWRIVVRPSRLMPFDLDPAQRYTLIYETYEPDIMIRDHAADDGGVPSSRHEPGSGWTPMRLWTSPDIIMEGGEVINPGVQEFMQVAVTNNGQATVNNITVHLYWANFGIGLDYADYLEHEMGSCEIESLEPGERSNPADCRIPYTWNVGDLIIGEDGMAHVCFLATAESQADDLTFEGDATLSEDADPRKFYIWDNNMAQQNLRHEMIYPGGDDGVFDFEIRNPEPAPARIQIEQDTTGLPDGWDVTVTPPPPFSLPAHGRTFAKVQIIPPADAPVGSSGQVSLYGRDTLNNRILTGFDAVVSMPLSPISPACVAAKVKAAASLCKAVVNCWIKEIGDKKNTFNPLGCIDGARTKFYISWDNAEQKALKKEFGCNTEDKEIIALEITNGIKEIYDQIAVDYDLEEKDGAALGKALLKAAGAKCTSLITAASADIKKNNADKLKKAVYKADTAFIKSWNKAMDKAIKKKVPNTPNVDLQNVIKTAIGDLTSLSGMVEIP